ncbi:MAG: hypothetical protein Q8K87_06765 [Hydrogenophaga sp.]|nr:hypothetical protein [Hydrogenophaga sp.]
MSVLHRRLPRSAHTNAATNNPCQTNPSVSPPINHFTHATLPSSGVAHNGTTTQAISAIGNAAAAQTANTCHREYCGMG